MQLFESICFRRMRGLGDPSPLDIGILAETLLFYGNVHFVAESDMLRQLIENCGPDAVLTLMEEGFLTVEFLAQPVGIGTYDSMSPEIGVHEIVSHLHYDLADEAEHAFRDVTRSASRGRNLAQRFTALARPIGYDHGFTTRFCIDLADTEYTGKAVTELLRRLAPGYIRPPDLRFDVTQQGSQLRLQTNIDFDVANTYYLVPSNASHLQHLDAQLLLLHLLEAQADLEFASHFNAEIAVSPVGASLMRLRMHNRSKASHHSTEEIAAFEKLVLPEGHRIREVIDSGEHTYDDIITLLRHAQKFRSWLADQPPSVHLASEYYRKVVAETWVDKLPGKAFRWFIMNMVGTGLGTLAGTAAGDPLVGAAVGAAASLVVSGADVFLLDRLLHGWKPNQFVEGPLASFVA